MALDVDWLAESVVWMESNLTATQEKSPHPSTTRATTPISRHAAGWQVKIRI